MTIKTRAAQKQTVLRTFAGKWSLGTTTIARIVATLASLTIGYGLCLGLLAHTYGGRALVA